MTLMTNDFNDHHDRMVVVEVFVYDKKAKPDALSSARLCFLIINKNLNNHHAVMVVIKVIGH